MMMKEILLTEDELKQLLRGTLVWSDIAYKLNTPTGARSPVRDAEHSSSVHDSGYSSRVLDSGLAGAAGTTGATGAVSTPGAMSTPGATGAFPGRTSFEEDEDFEDMDLLAEFEGLKSASSPLSGKKVIALLSGTGIVVVSLWLYYLIG